MQQADKYQIGYYPVSNPPMLWAQKDHLESPPIWCSVDLRDGNQSLIVPMSLEQKLEFFQFLCKIGFKEIEVGFPAASETEYTFLRALIEQNLIPSDVTIQVLTQSREHIIRKTFDSLQGCHTPVIVHFYNSTSTAQREQVFKKSKEEIKKIATDGATLIKKLSQEYDGNFRFEYSPESFTGTEPEYALEVCNAVLDILQPTAQQPVIINLPVTVAMSMSHVYANQVEYMSMNLHHPENVILSLHPHNDRGCAVADTELGLLAGADRVEGTLFGNGERTGNVDLVTLAMNLYSHGIDPKLDFSDMPSVVAQYEKATKMQVYDRTPYAGALVFAAFSGSHQDAIAKGMEWRKQHNLYQWNVPYLPIDPADVGREYQTDVIRINSQSGKGGIGYLLETRFGYHLPAKMREDFGYKVKAVSDHNHKELSPEEILEIFCQSYLNLSRPVEISVPEYTLLENNTHKAEFTLQSAGVFKTCSAVGNGRLDAACNAIRQGTGMDFSIITYSEHALEQGSTSLAAAYVGLQWKSGAITWGAGTHTDIMTASIHALLSAINNK